MQNSEFGLWSLLCSSVHSLYISHSEFHIPHYCYTATGVT